jgi:hypothetical protein
MSFWSPYPCPASASPSVSLQDTEAEIVVGRAIEGKRRITRWRDRGEESIQRSACVCVETYGRGRCCGRPWGHPPGRRSPSTSRHRRLRIAPINDLRTTAATTTSSSSSSSSSSSASCPPASLYPDLARAGWGGGGRVGRRGMRRCTEAGGRRLVAASLHARRP